MDSGRSSFTMYYHNVATHHHGCCLLKTNIWLGWYLHRSYIMHSLVVRTFRKLRYGIIILSPTLHTGLHIFPVYYGGYTPHHNKPAAPTIMYCSCPTHAVCTTSLLRIFSSHVRHRMINSRNIFVESVHYFPTNKIFFHSSGWQQKLLYSAFSLTHPFCSIAASSFPILLSDELHRSLSYLAHFGITANNVLSRESWKLNGMRRCTAGTRWSSHRFPQAISPLCVKKFNWASLFLPP